IRASSGWERNDNADGSCRLRPSSVIGGRHNERERGGAGGQMEKLSAGEVHFLPPLTSFYYPVGAGEQRWCHAHFAGLCGGLIDDEIELGRLFDGDVCGLRPTQNLVD